MTRKLGLTALILLAINVLFAQTYTYPLKGDPGFNFSEKTRDGIRVDYNLGEFTLNQINYRGEAMSEISISAIVFPNEEGYPNLPVESRFVAIPQEAEASLEVISFDTEIIPNVNIAPALRIQAESEEPEMNYVKNLSVYQNNAFYPEKPFSIDKTVLRGVDAVALSVSPFQYNPVTKELKVYTNIKLALRFNGGNGHFGEDRLRSMYWDPILMQNLVNYDQLPVIDYEARMQEWINNRATGCEYLIVIPNKESFRQYANQLKDYRIAQGIKTEVKSLSEMGCSSIDDMKTYFHNAYNNWTIAPVAVLLLGDHDTNMSRGIPAETVPHPKNDVCISDNGFADANGDYLPDMVFSRLVAETPDEAEIMVSKVMDYEYLQANTNSSTYDHPITACGWQTERWFQLCAEVVGGYWRNQGKHPVRINEIYGDDTPGSSWSTANNTSSVVSYFGPNGAGYIPTSPASLGGWTGGDAYDVVNAINSGAMMLQHRDHGYIYGWGQPNFNKYYVEDLTNVGKLTFVNTINCLTGKFDESSDCLVEAFMRYTYNGQNAGAVGCIAPTEVSYSFANDVFVWGMYDFYDPSFMPSHSTNVSNEGNWMPAFGNVAGKYCLSQSSWYSNTSIKRLTYNMFTSHCDAFLRLYTTVPMTINSTVPSHISATTTSISVTAPSGSIIALTRDNNIIALATGTGGSKTISFSAQPAGSDLKLVITKQNYLRKEYTIRVDGGAPSVVSCSVTNIGENSATLKAQVIPGGADASYYFLWGITNSYGHQTSSGSLSASNDPSNVSKSISGLQSNTEYHYCIRVENSYGVKYSDDYTFTTSGTTNNPPTKPSNPNPSNGAYNVPENQTLSWTSTDPDGGGVSYDLYLGTSSSNMPKIRSGSGTSCGNIGFNLGTTYFWKVVSYDSQNASISGPVWSFTTATNTNFQISVSAGSNGGGTVTGGGDYVEDQPCTVTASANSGCTFVNWTENGTVVSTSPSYSFIVSGNRTLVANFTSPVFQTSMSDDFNDGVINSTYWTIHGSDVTEAEGMLKMDQNVTDDNVSLLSAPMHVSSNNKIVMERKFMVHKGNSYFYGGYAFEFNGSSGVHTVPMMGAFDVTIANTTGVDYISVIYCHTTYEGKYGIYVETGIGSDAHGIRICDAVFDTWLTERIVVDLSAGTVSYYLDNNFITTLGVPGLQSLPVNYYTAIFRPWGWAEGHCHYMDYVNLNTETSYAVQANANPSAGGTITGTGNYQGGSVCSLMAISNEGYSFTNWTENGEVVSYNAIYSFTVTGARDLTANFSSNGFVVTAVASPTNGGSVSGGGTYYPGTTCALTATANTGYTFTNWTLNGTVVSTSPTYSFTVNQNVTYVANFSNGGGEITQTTNLSSGWTWWSTYVEQQGNNGLAQMEQSLGDAGVTIKSQANGFVTNDGFWYGSLTGINNESTYFIQTGSSCLMTVTGNQAMPSSHPISLPTGWTWIGYPSGMPMSVTTAMSGLSPMSEDQLKSQQGFAMYTPGIGWLGSLQTVTPGMGLMFESHNTSMVTLTYPNPNKLEELKDNITPRGNHWEPEMKRYPDNMSVVTVVELDGFELDGDRYELAAFAEGESRGSAVMMRMDALDRTIAFLTIYGEEPTELSFALYDRLTGEEFFESQDRMVFVPNTTVGSPREPYVISFRGLTGVEEFAGRVRVFPNPVERGQWVSVGIAQEESECMEITIINAMGVEMSQKASQQPTGIFKAPDTPGIYILRIAVKGKGICYRSLIVK
jgi:hypothetical protein